MYSNVWLRLILVDTQIVEGLIGVKSLALTETYPDIKFYGATVIELRVFETWYNFHIWRFLYIHL